MNATITHRRKVREQKLAEACPDCGKTAAWQAVTRVLPQEFRGHTLNVETACQECSHCGFRVLTNAQMDSLKKRKELPTFNPNMVLQEPVAH
jgi:C4-type Zn-finger protein